jgi:plastocyanin
MKQVQLVPRWGVALAIALSAIIAPWSQLAAQAAAPWQMSVGASSADQAVQVNYFLPGQIWIHVGDQVNWTWRSGEIHTVSFLNGKPPAFDPFNPFGGGTYDGTSQVSSGVRADGLGGPYNLTFTKAGDYQFNCLVHAPMSGVVHVRPAGSSLPHDQAWYDQQAAASRARRLSQGQQQISVALQSTKYGQDTAGIGLIQDTGSIAVLRFLPQDLTVKVNQTLVFNTRDPQTPHTITFGAFAADPTPPFGTDAPGHATIGSTSQVVNSGFLWAQPLPGFPTFGTTFSVKFTATGVYNFRCELHDTLGMTGVVTVTN